MSVVHFGFAPITVQALNDKKRRLPGGTARRDIPMHTTFTQASPADRVLCAALRERIMTADQAASLIQSGMTLGMSGFTPAGAPKAVP